MIKQIVVVAILLFSAGVGADQMDRKDILNGVREIGVPGIPGAVCAFGSDSFAVVAPQGKDGSRLAVVAATRFGKGRAVAFGHNGYFTGKTLGQSDTTRLILNATRWAAGGPVSQPKVGVYENKQLATFFADQGFDVKSVMLRNLDGIDVLVGKISKVKMKDVSRLARFVREGGGLITGMPGWGWQMLNDGKSLQTDFPGNQLFAPMGIVWGSDQIRPANKGDGFVVADTLDPLLNASRALDLAETMQARTGKADAHTAAQATVTLGLALQGLPPDDALLLPRLKKLTENTEHVVVPTRRNPVRSSQIIDRIVVTQQTKNSVHAVPQMLKAHPAADVFPGSVPADAPRVRKKVIVDTSVPRWHSTGLYAAPGKLVTVRVPAKAVSKGLKLRIGAHKDRIWHKSSWSRYPEISRVYPINGPSTVAANSFGGAVYVVVPKNCGLRTVEVEIEGAVEAPFFLLGETSLDEWRNTVRYRPAPWAEIASSKVVLTVHSDYVRELDDPESLMKTWDRIMDACADLAVRSRDRTSPERYVADVQISAGALHAGYPIMGHMNANEALVDEQKLVTEGNWGLFHEMGHNHQNRDWTFDGTGEVTVNLFSLYVKEKICGVKPADDRRVGLDARVGRIQKFLDTGEKPPFVFLVMYVQMQEEFGWDAFKKVFAEYRDLPNSERPRNDGQKRDQWLVRFSNTVGRNLGPFFEAWDVKTSETARKTVAHLPVWMPDGFPPA